MFIYFYVSFYLKTIDLVFCFCFLFCCCWCLLLLFLLLCLFVLGVVLFLFVLSCIVAGCDSSMFIFHVNMNLPLKDYRRQLAHELIPRN